MTAPDPQAAHDLASRVYATHRGYSFVEAIRQYLDAVDATETPDLRATTREFLRAQVVNAAAAHKAALQIAMTTFQAHENAVRALREFGDA